MTVRFIKIYLSFIVDNNYQCHFDQVFNTNSTQTDIFDFVRSSINQVTDGYNCTIFAYGQTGSGKTYTMFGKSKFVLML